MSYPRISQGLYGSTLVDGSFYPHSFELSDLDNFEAFVEQHSRCMWYSDVAHESVVDPSAIAIRHDVDHSIIHARRFARWEAERGINASYFILPTAAYFVHERTPQVMLDIQELGHEVGIHNDALTHAARWQSGDQRITGQRFPDEALDDVAMTFLADWKTLFESYGIHVTGCADHGGGLPRNIDLWDAYSRSPHEVDLAYECYALHGRSEVYYVSDNHGKWNSPLAKAVDDPLAKLKGKQTHVLIHPEHWRLPA